MMISACTPVPMTQERAARECASEAELADGVRGNVGVGIGNTGASGKAGITVTNRVFNPQSERDFMRECIARKMSGAPKPTTFGVTVGGSF